MAAGVGSLAHRFADKGHNKQGANQRHECTGGHPGGGKFRQAVIQQAPPAGIGIRQAEAHVVERCQREHHRRKADGAPGRRGRGGSAPRLDGELPGSFRNGRFGTAAFLPGGIVLRPGSCRQAQRSVRRASQSKAYCLRQYKGR